MATHQAYPPIGPRAAGRQLGLDRASGRSAAGNQLGQQVIIDNRGGAGGVVATKILARSAPDGHTIGFVYTPLTNQPSFNDFAPLTMMTAAPLVLVVKPAVPAKSVQDLIALAKVST